MKSAKFTKRVFEFISLIIILSVLLLLASCATSGNGGKSETSVRTIFAMSTTISLQLEGVDAEKTSDDIVQALEDFETAASMHLEDSDVDNINRNAGVAAVEVGESVYYVISRALQAARQTDGLFDITIGAVTSIWGIGSDKPKLPLKEEIEKALKLVDYNSVVISSKDGVYTVMLKEKHQKIDLGGIAKGYALDIIREILEQSSVKHGLISVGGNVMVYKDKAGKPFVVGIRYPETDNFNVFCALNLTDTVLSTTGGYERFFEQDGIVYHHVIDPRTGYPSQSGLTSVSVVHRDGLTADYLSTALFIGGMDYSLALMQKGEVEAVIIDANNNVYVTKSLKSSMIQDKCDTDTYTFIYV